MAKLGYFTRAQAVAARAEPLGLHISYVPLQTGCISPAARRAAFFCDYVLAVMKHDPIYAKAWSALNFTGGMKIYTTLGPQDQQAAEHAVNFVQPANSSYYNPGHNADTEVLIQPGTGYIRAIAVNRLFGTGTGHTTVDYAVNTPYGASAGVQTGSSSKIFTLVTALKQGLPFGYHLRVTSPTTVGPYYNCHGGYVPPFHVINAEGPQGAKTYTIYDGTIASINAFYATLEQRVGLCDVVRTAASLGMTRADGTSLLRRDRHLPASSQPIRRQLPVVHARLGLRVPDEHGGGVRHAGRARNLLQANRDQGDHRHATGATYPVERARLPPGHFRGRSRRRQLRSAGRTRRLAAPRPTAASESRPRPRPAPPTAASTRPSPAIRPAWPVTCRSSIRSPRPAAGRWSTPGRTTARWAARSVLLARCSATTLLARPGR